MPLLEMFEGIALLSFIVVVLAGGVFVIYFGNTKSRIKGFIVFIIGIIALLAFLKLTWGMNLFPFLPPEIWTPSQLLEGIVSIVGAIVGIGIALLLILLSIMMYLNLYFTRKLCSKDLARVMQISANSLTERYDLSTFVELLRLSPDLCLVEENMIGKVIGFIIGIKTSFDRGRILILAVDEPYRWRGVGSKLLNKCIELMKQRRLKVVTLEVRVNNKEAINFYLKRGFKIKELLPCFYSDGTDGYLMERKL
jgi:ribosomal protein S18 acetylase RimI-like enzyme